MFAEEQGTGVCTCVFTHMLHVVLGFGSNACMRMCAHALSCKVATFLQASYL